MQEQRSISRYSQPSTQDFYLRSDRLVHHRSSHDLKAGKLFLVHEGRKFSPRVRSVSSPFEVGHDQHRRTIGGRAFWWTAAAFA